MTHFVVAVILPKGANPTTHAQAEAMVEPLLARYDENMEVEPYERDCWCVGTIAQREVREQAAREMGTIDDFRRTFVRPEGVDDFSDELDEAWDKHIQPLRDREAELLAQHPLREAPDPTCGFYTEDFVKRHYPDRPELVGQRFEDGSGCGGTGRYTSTYNPDSKFDWWVIGGRWSGYWAPEGAEPTHHEWNGPRYALKEDVKRVRDIPSDKRPRAVVTPDGLWHQRGEAGWFGVFNDAMDREQWEQVTNAIYSEHLDHLAVCCDLHI